MKTHSLLAALVLAAFTHSLAAQQTLLLRQPAVSQDRLAFVYAGDIWIAGLDGSQPRRLTSHPAEENTPVFSPDGQTLAFAGAYEGNIDVYVVAAQGGQPQRLTWHPGPDVPQGWSADGGAVAFVSQRETDHGRSGQWYHVALAGGLPEKQMQARVYRGAYNAGGDLAYIAFRSGYDGLFGGTAGWKGYRGGTTPAIQIMDAARRQVTTVDGAGATNFNPFWLDGTLCFLSDRDDTVFNLFSYDPAGGEIRRLTRESRWSIRSAGGSGSTVVYEAGGRLWRLDLAGGAPQEIVISIAPDLPQLRTQWKDAAAAIEHADISTTGKRVLLTARGDVFSVPVEDGSIRNLSATGAQREYTARWSPDGQQVAWITETAAGQAVVVADQAGTTEGEPVVLGPHFYELLTWTPGDSPRLVYTDNHLGLHALDLGSGKSQRIATGARRDQIDAAPSPDGRWLAYTLERPNFHRQLMLHDFESGQNIAVGDALADAASPAFSPDGKFLYFAASTNSGPLQVGLNMTSQERPYRASLYAAVLSRDEASPLQPKPGDEEATPSAEEDHEEDDEEGDEEGDEKDRDDKKKSAPPPPVRIDLEGLNARIVALPVAESSYGNLQVGEDGDLFYIDAVQPGATNPPPDEQAEKENQLVRFDFEEMETKVLLSDVTRFAISHDGTWLIVQKADESLATAEIEDEMELEELDVSDVRLRVDPREEWAQIFDEAWRMEQEYFYADNLHGLDWDAVYRQYRPLVDHVGRREDLNDLIVEMIAELQVGHNRAGGGDLYQGESAKTGLLGANFAIENGRYRLAKVYSGESWNPFVKAPLAVPGNEARAGEYLLAVNGAELTATDNLFARLQGTVGQQVRLRVGPNANGRNARDIVVVPVEDERELRLWSWIEANRRQVDEATGGRVGYIYLPNTGGAGYTYFNRMFFSQLDKDALIIDERSNAGGQAANYIVEVLSRLHLSGWADRDGLVFNTPAGAVHGPKLMLIDQDAGSGGDYLPYAFRYAGIGKLMGTRTWGGLIGISTNPPLMDGGRLVVPFFRFFDPAGDWSVENEGVAPDIEVTLDPIATNRGEDSQLQAAIAEILRQLEGFEPKVMKEAPPLPTELGE